MISIPSTLASPDLRKPGGWARGDSWKPREGVCEGCGEPALIEHYRSIQDGSLKRVIRCKGSKRPPKGCRWEPKIYCCPPVTVVVESEDSPMPILTEEQIESIRSRADKQGVTLKEVATVAEVGESTLKKGLSGRYDMSEKTLEKVTAALDDIEARLHPDFVKRALALVAKFGLNGPAELAALFPKTSKISGDKLAAVVERRGRWDDITLNTVEMGIQFLEQQSKMVPIVHAEIAKVNTENMRSALSRRTTLEDKPAPDEAVKAPKPKPEQTLSNLLGQGPSVEEMLKRLEARIETCLDRVAKMESWQAENVDGHDCLQERLDALEAKLELCNDSIDEAHQVLRGHARLHNLKNANSTQLQDDLGTIRARVGTIWEFITGPELAHLNHFLGKIRPLIDLVEKLKVSA